VQQLLLKLQELKGQTTEISIVWSDNAKTVWQEELSNKNYDNFPFKTWDKNDFYAPFASGSSNYNALIICPCSMGTLGRIAGGISDNLITRAADVMLKERRKLICVIREMPYSLIHINNMKTVTEAGGIICPASPSFYHKPASMEDAVQTVVDRVINLAGLNAGGYQWGGND
jgi:4-hydroxy-3-polyprenylbenzoate decarboxylase